MTIKEEMMPKKKQEKKQQVVEMKPKPKNQNHEFDKLKECLLDKDERINKLENCMYDKDKRISKLENLFLNVKKSILFAGLFCLGIFIIFGWIYFAQTFSYLFEEILKVIGVGTIALIVTIIVLSLVNMIYNVGKDEDHQIEILDSENIFYFGTGVIVIVELLYLMIIT